MPLIISLPERFQSNVQSEALVELVDLAPTLLAAAELEIPLGMQGRSLLPLLTGEADAIGHRSFVVCDFYDSLGYSPVDTPTQATMTYDGRYKMVLYHREDDLAELFDLAADPGEFTNLWDDPSAGQFKLTRMRAHIDAVMATISPGGERVATY